MYAKYELLRNNFINYKGRILFRIRALKDFSDVKKGDLGGYVQSESNLNHNDSCWIYDNAKVYGIVYQKVLKNSRQEIHIRY